MARLALLWELCPASSGAVGPAWLSEFLDLTALRSASTALLT